MDWKTQYCKDVNSFQTGSQIQYKIQFNKILVRTKKFQGGNNNLILKFMWKCKEVRKARITLKNKVGSLALPNKKTNYKLSN